MACLTDAQRSLVESNIGLAWHALSKLRLSPGDYLGAAYEGLCRAAATYNESKGRFSTYAYLAILRTVERDATKMSFNGFSGCWSTYNREDGKIPDICKVVSLQKPVYHDSDSSPALESVIPSTQDVEADAVAEVTAGEILDVLTPRQREYIERMVTTGDSRRSIEIELGISHNSIHEAMKVARRRIKSAIPDIYEDAVKGRALGKY